MNLLSWRFSTIMLTGVTLSAALAHLMELPAKKSYDAALYVELQQTLYPTFGKTAGFAEILSVLSTLGLAWWTKKNRPGAFPLTVASAACLTAAHVAFLALVYPANKAMAGWPLDSIPPEWTQWRDQWEYTHAARAVLTAGAFGTLVLSVLQETPEVQK